MIPGIQFRSQTAPFINLSFPGQVMSDILGNYQKGKKGCRLEVPDWMSPEEPMSGSNVLLNRIYFHCIIFLGHYTYEPPHGTLKCSRSMDRTGICTCQIYKYAFYVRSLNWSGHVPLTFPQCEAAVKVESRRYDVDLQLCGRWQTEPALTSCFRVCLFLQSISAEIFCMSTRASMYERNIGKTKS